MSLKDALAGIKEAQAAPEQRNQAPPKPAAPRTRQPSKTAAAAEPTKPAPGKRLAWVRGEGKRSNPDYERLTVFVRSDTRKKALRKWEDEGGGDASDLVQQLLATYLSS